MQDTTILGSPAGAFRRMWAPSRFVVAPTLVPLTTTFTLGNRSFVVLLHTVPLSVPVPACYCLYTG